MNDPDLSEPKPSGTLERDAGSQNHRLHPSTWQPDSQWLPIRSCRVTRAVRRFETPKQAVKEDPNPYSPVSTVDVALAGGSRWRAVPSFVTGFFGGTALQWVLFWTDSFSTEVPPLGGALLGLLSMLAINFPVVRNRPAFLLGGAIVGNLNAFWCNKAPLLYWDIPRDVVTAWGLASIAFALTFACSFSFVSLARRTKLFQPYLVHRHSEHDEPSDQPKSRSRGF